MEFAACTLAEASMTLGFTLELITPDLRGKIFWDDFQFIGSLILPLALLAFTFRYTRRELPRPRLTWWVLGILVTGFMVLVYTNPLHGLIRSESYLVPGQPFAVLEYDYTLAFWAYVLFVYGIVAYSLGILFQEATQVRRLHRTQVVIILVGFLFPILSGIVSVLEIEIGPYRDVTPLGFALGNLMIAWGLFRYRLFALGPVARQVVVENMTDAVMVLDADHRIVDLNAAAEEIIGRSAAEVLGQPTEAVLDRWPNLLAEFRDTEEEYAEIAYTLEGQERYADLTISPLYDDWDQFAGRVLVSRDITQRKRAEEALRESEARYRLLAENTSDYILRLDQDGKVIFATDASRRFHGYAPDDLIGTLGFERVHPDDREEAMAKFESALDAGEDARHEYRLQCKDGGYMWVETAGRLIHNTATGNPEVILVARDATARKEAEQALQRAHDELERRVEERTAELQASEARYRLLAENVDDVLWTRDANLERYTYVSPSIERLLGYTPEEMMARPASDFIAPNSYGRIGSARELRLGAEVADVDDDLLRTWEVEWVRKDGSTVWVENRARVLRDEADQYQGVVGVTRDISERKEAAETLRQYTERLQTLYQISEGIIAAHSPQAIARVALGYVRQLVPCQGIIIARADDANDEVVFLATDLDDQIDVSEGLDLSVEQRLMFSDVAEHLRTGQSAIVELGPQGSELSQAFAAMGARVVCHAPMLVQQELIGSMAILVSDSAVCTSGYMDTVRRVADQLAIAIRQAQLHEQAQQYSQELEQRNWALALLNEASRAFSATLDQDQVFDAVLEEARTLLDVDAMAIWLPDPETGELICHRVAGLRQETMHGWRLPPGKGLAGWVAQHGENLIVPDLREDERFFQDLTEQAGLATRSVLSVPLRFKDDLVGVLQAVDTAYDYFTADHLALLEPLAASAVIAIENARLFEEARIAREQLQALSRNLVDIQEAERAWVARELHDEAGQSLSYLLMSLGMLKRDAGDLEVVIRRAGTMTDMIEALLENLHRLAVRLRPAALDHLGLVPALEQYTEMFVDRSGIETQFAAIGLEGERLPPDVETALYRVVQEALNNVLRHADASQADVLLDRRGDQIVVVIEDDGVGFDSETAAEQGRLGLVGMRERAYMLGGTLTIESSPGQGTTIVVEVPHDDSDSGC
jgi:PAS domain S-box-containing protein